jgi:hypothetical protein
MVCFRYIFVNTLRKGDKKDDDDDYYYNDDDNNNNKCDCLELLNLRPTLHILMQKAAILSTCRVTGKSLAEE